MLVDQIVIILLVRSTIFLLFQIGVRVFLHELLVVYVDLRLVASVLPVLATACLLVRAILEGAVVLRHLVWVQELLLWLHLPLLIVKRWLWPEVLSVGQIEVVL